jgi:hypothetical protein
MVPLQLGFRFLGAVHSQLERRCEMLKPRYMLAFCIVVLTATLCPTVSAQVVDQNDQSVERKVVSPAEIPPLQNVLYGAAYYNEYIDLALRMRIP